MKFLNDRMKQHVEKNLYNYNYTCRQHGTRAALAPPCICSTLDYDHFYSARWCEMCFVNIALGICILCYYTYRSAVAGLYARSPAGLNRCKRER